MTRPPRMAPWNAVAWRAAPMAMAHAEHALDGGRASFGRQAWGDAYAQLSTADKDAPLELDDLERLAVAAHMVGRGRIALRATLRARRRREVR